MKKQLLILLLLIICLAVKAQTPVLNLSIADANMLPSMKPSGAHYKVDRVYGLNLQTEYYFKYGVPTSPLSPFLASLHLNIISTYVDPSTGMPVVGYWTTEKVYSAFDNTIDFRRSMMGLYTLTDAQKSDSLRIAADSTRLETYKGVATTALAGKFNNPTGTSGQYLNGLGVPVNFPNITPDSTVFRTVSNSLSLAQTQTRFNAKENVIISGTTAQYWRGDKTWQTLDKSAVGLGNVDNTSDANKPISNAVQTALNSKQNNLTLTTTGSGAASLVGSTLNIPTPTAPDTAVYRTTSNSLTLAQLQTKFNLYVPNARTLTINGTTQDLTANRTWNVGDLLSTGSYANPSWITSLGWSKITGTPTTLSGYGITDGVSNSSLTTTLSGYATTSALTSGLAGKFNTPTGNTTQYIRGDGSLATFPTTGTVTSVGLSSTDLTISGSPITTSGTITANLANTGVTAGTYGKVTVDAKGRVTSGKRQESYIGTTDASGNYTVTFATAYSSVPNIQQNLIGGNALQGTLISSITTTGFTIQAYTRSTVSTLPVIGVLTATLVGTATNPLVGGTVHVLISEP